MKNESKDEDDSHDSSDSCNSNHNNENNNEEEDKAAHDDDNNYNDDNNEQDNNANEGNNHIVHHCFNCHRRQSTLLQQFGPSYHTEFFQLMSTDVKTRRRFKLCNINYSDPNESNTYCRQCTEHLTRDTSNEANKAEVTWPAFIWWFLTEREIRCLYSPSHLWKFIPIMWRHWWITEFITTIFNADERNSITLHHPQPFFIDRTCDIQEWYDGINSYTLPNLRFACNKYCIPTVSCPFGCTTFVFRSGSIGLDTIFQRFLPKHIFKKFLTKKDSFKFCEFAREDYIRDEDDEYDNWLLNPVWKVRPTIAFNKRGIPMILTCDDHNNGTKTYLIHAPRSPLKHNLPSKYSDQLSHCSIRTRTIKPMAKKYYSNSFQMHEQRGSFNGIDTCNISTYRKFDFNSSLLSAFESSSILNRPDINALLRQLVDENVISKSVAVGKRDFACETYSNYDFDKYCKGATYVPFDVALAMHKETTNNLLVTVTIDER